MIFFPHFNTEIPICDWYWISYHTKTKIYLSGKSRIEILELLVNFFHFFLLCYIFYIKFSCFVVFEGFHGEDRCERVFAVTPKILSWERDGGPEKGPTHALSSLSQERIHGVTANPCSHWTVLCEESRQTHNIDLCVWVSHVADDAAVL